MESHPLWAVQVATATDLPDARLTTRFATILLSTAEHPSASIPQATGQAGQAKAADRFYANDRVTTTALHQGLARDTARRCLDQPVVLLVQDTTSLHLTGLRGLTELGPIDSGSHARGLFLHSTLAVTATGQVLGLFAGRGLSPARPDPRRRKVPRGSTVSTRPAPPCTRRPTSGRSPA